MDAARLELYVCGPNAEAVAARLRDALDEGRDEVLIRATDAPPPAVERDGALVVGMLSLVLSLPSALLAVEQLRERRRKKELARRLLETAREAHREDEGKTTILLSDGRSLDALDEDELIRLAKVLEEAAESCLEEARNRAGD